MSRIRAFETLVAHHFRAGDIHGFVHTSIGQEGVAAGVCSALEHGDYVTTTHRGHGHCLAMGADPVAMMAELFGRITGLCGGKGGSMHLADAQLGILGANGIVGAGIPLAVGAALAAQYREDRRVSIAFFGEGALHTGAFHEAASLAVAWQLPVVLVCDCNGWAEFTRTDTWRGPGPAARGASYGLDSHEVDGTDVIAVACLADAVLSAVRAGRGPAFIEARSVRAHGHYEGDAQQYRVDGDTAPEASDPLLRATTDLGLNRDVAQALEDEAAVEMSAAVTAALDAPYPSAVTVNDDVYA
jgi:TPP-dependent pyruvate/acetoin dehydrogenase alpha subunit